MATGLTKFRYDKEKKYIFETGKKRRKEMTSGKTNELLSLRSEETIQFSLDEKTPKQKSSSASSTWPNNLRF